jgi:hypothetical protein
MGGNMTGGNMILRVNFKKTSAELNSKSWLPDNRICNHLNYGKTYHDYMKKVFLESASVLSTGIVLLLLSTIEASAQPLVKDTPTGTLTDGSISISPEEPLPANGTVSISTEGVTDTNMNVIPPEGVSVIISSDSVTVTNQAVDIETADEDEGDEGGGVNGNEEDEQGGGEEPAE